MEKAQRCHLIALSLGVFLVAWGRDQIGAVASGLAAGCLGLTQEESQIAAMLQSLGESQEPHGKRSSMVPTSITWQPNWRNYLKITSCKARWAQIGSSWRRPMGSYATIIAFNMTNGSEVHGLRRTYVVHVPWTQGKRVKKIKSWNRTKACSKE